MSDKGTQASADEAAYIAARAKRLNKGMAKRIASPWSDKDTNRLLYRPDAMHSRIQPRRDDEQRDAELMARLVRTSSSNGDK